MAERWADILPPPEPTPGQVVMAHLVLAFGVFVLFGLGGLGLGLAAAIWQRSLSALATGFALGTGAGGLAVLCLATRGTLYGLELATGRDLNGNGFIADRPILLRATNAPDPAALADAGAFADFVNGCQVDTSLRRWEPALGRTRYQDWRDKLIAAGYARWRGADERTGWELTAEPAVILAAAG